MNLQIRKLALALALVFAAGAVQAQDIADRGPAEQASDTSGDSAAAHDAGHGTSAEHAGHMDGDDAAAPPTVPATVDAPHDPSAPHPAPVHPELAGVFADFGGMPGMTALMDDFMAVMLADPRLQRFFANTDQVRIKRQLAEQFCAILGGGCVYSGRDMKTTHAAFAIDRANFNALVEDLQVAMNRKRIPFRSQNKLLAVLAPMHREAVTR